MNHVRSSLTVLWGHWHRLFAAARQRSSVAAFATGLFALASCAFAGTPLTAPRFLGKIFAQREAGSPPPSLANPATGSPSASAQPTLTPPRPRHLPPLSRQNTKLRAAPTKVLEEQPGVPRRLPPVKAERRSPAEIKPAPSISKRLPEMEAEPSLTLRSEQVELSLPQATGNTLPVAKKSTPAPDNVTSSAPVADRAQPSFAPPVTPQPSPAPSLGTPPTVPLPEPPRPTPRTADWKRFEPQIRSAIERGYDLAGRGAGFSARAEFLGSLRTIAQVLDTTEGTRRHTTALAAALRAMEEAEDFLPRRAGMIEEVDLEQIITGHRTRLLDTRSVESITPLAAMQRYFTYAREQLASAFAGVPLAAEPLFALGKMQNLMTDDGEATRALRTARTLVFHQAALEADPRHARAANELGVALAKIGRLEEARDVLRQAVSAAPTREMWHNLAVVHHRLGETRLAKLADAEAARSASRQATPDGMARPLVQWVKDDVFRSARPVR